MCHQKGDFFVRKKVLSLLLAFCMIVAPFTVVQVAAETTQVLDSDHLRSAVDAAEDGDVIQLGADIAVTDSLRFDGDGTVTLDLNGHTLSMDGSQLKEAGVLINVVAGSVIVDDTKGNGQILANETYTGKAGETAYTLRCVQVYGGAEFTLRGGTLENTNKDFNATQTISNYGTVNVEDGTIKGVTGIFCFAPVLGNSAWSNQKAVCNISDGEILGTPAESYQDEQKDGYVGASYGVALYGPGYTSSGVDNDAVILNMDGGVIRAIQGIATNASSGKYAGFTINMTNGLIDGTENGTGMYLPAMGVTNISGGEVTGAQGIRICAGELNMTSGTLTGTALSDGEDLVAGGSGGTNGALVVGKASNGYVGDIDINISGDAVIQNTAAGGENDVQPTIVVSDKNMASTVSQEIKNKDGTTISNYSYSGTSISVSVDGAEIDGDVVKISNLTQSTTTFDGGSTTLQLNNAAVSGDVINQTSGTSLSVDGGSIGGDVKNIGKGSISMQKTSVTGSVVNDDAGAVTVVESTVQGSVENSGSGTVTLIGTDVEGEAPGSDVTVLPSVTDDQIVSSYGKTYESDELATALSELPAGGTLYLGKGTFQLFSAVTIDKSVTLRGQGAENTIIQGVSTDPTVYFTVTKGNVVFDGMTFEDFGGESPTVQGIGVITVPESARGVELTVKNTTIKDFVRAGIDIGAGKFTISNCTIDCKNTYIQEETGTNYLTKGLCIGNGSEKAEGTLDQVTILNAQSGYSDWSAFAIEIFQNSDVAITNTEVSLCDYGIWVDSYSPSSASGSTVASVTLGEGNNIVPNEETPKESVFVAVDSSNSDLSAQVSITGGSYDGPVYIYDYTKGECLSNTEDNFILISGGRFHNLTPEDMEEDISYIADGYHMDSNGNIKKDTSSHSSSSSSDDPGSALPLAPGASYQPGEPSDPTQPGAPSGFVSDTTNDLTVNGTYQFRITSLDGTIPFLTVDNANFRVEFASQEGNDFFFKIHAQGAAGSTAVVSVNGVRLLTATVGGSATGVISDTTAPFTVKKGETYQFRLTASARPSFAAGSASFTVEYAGQIGSDYFYKVYAAGNVGDGCGFYINGEASPVAVATIA